MIDKFKNSFVKGLESLKTEISLFQKEEDLWKPGPGISNSAGNLTLHLIGNLNHFIGAQLGKTGYIREREKEFSDKNIPAAELIFKIEATIKMINITFEQLTESTLKNAFPLNTLGENKTVDEALLILLAHLNYHLGQINYCRRLT